MPDVRLIDANALIKAIKGDHCKGCNNYGCIMCRVCTWMDAMDYIEDAPTIEAQPVKHGNWNVTGEYFDKEEHEEKIDFQCSKCSMIYTLTKNRAMPNYCEHCGSKNVRCEYG